MAEPAVPAAAAAAEPEVDDLVTRAAAGDESARSELVERSRRQVHGWCSRILGDAEGAEDATQETLLQVWRHIGSLREPRAFPAWLYRTTLNACLSQRTRAPALGRLGADAGDVERLRCQGSWTATPEELAVARSELERLVADLRGPERELLSLRYRKGLSAREIGSELRISEGAARTRLHAVIAKLRQLVRSPGERD